MTGRRRRPAGWALALALAAAGLAPAPATAQAPQEECSQRRAALEALQEEGGALDSEIRELESIGRQLEKSSDKDLDGALAYFMRVLNQPANKNDKSEIVNRLRRQADMVTAIRAQRLMGALAKVPTPVGGLTRRRTEVANQIALQREAIASRCGGEAKGCDPVGTWQLTIPDLGGPGLMSIQPGGEASESGYGGAVGRWAMQHRTLTIGWRAEEVSGGAAFELDATCNAGGGSVNFKPADGERETHSATIVRQ